jgi:hypothetical protein
MSEQPAPGQEVRSDDPGVPNDPPGPDVPADTGPSLSPDVPVGPQVEQPEGTSDVDGADPHRGETEPDDDDETDSPPGAGGDGDGPEEHDHPD